MSRNHRSYGSPYRQYSDGQHADGQHADGQCYGQIQGWMPRSLGAIVFGVLMALVPQAAIHAQAPTAAPRTSPQPVTTAPSPRSPQSIAQTPARSSPRLPDTVSQAVLKAVAADTRQPAYLFKITESQLRIWPNGCLGLGAVDTACTQARVAGWRVLATDGKNTWTYRTNGSGSLVKAEVGNPPASAVPSVRRPTSPNARSLPNSSTTSTAPPPEQRQLPSAQIQLVKNRVQVRLINRTGAIIDYQVIGDTTVRLLPGEQTITLQDLAIPLTLTFRRRDFGLLEVATQAGASPSSLDVYLDATVDLALDRTTLSIEPTGDVFLN